jgi:hypothetical protein
MFGMSSRPTRQTGHGDLVGALDFGNDTVSRDRSREDCENVGVLHFDLRIVFSFKELYE